MSKKTILTIGLIMLINIFIMIGVYLNANFTINSFFEGLLIETLGWVFAVTLFQSYYDEKIKERDNKSENGKSFVTTLHELATLYESGLITEKEYTHAKAKLLDTIEKDAKQ